LAGFAVHEAALPELEKYLEAGISSTCGQYLGTARDGGHDFLSLGK
jgi:hypothetical protein